MKVVVLIGVAVILAGCELPSGPRRSPPPDLGGWEIVDGNDPGATCECARASQKYLLNLRATTRTVGVHASETNIFSNVVVDRPLQPDPTVGENGKRFLGCSLLSLKSDCDTTVTYRITRPAEGKQPLLKSKTGAQSLLSLIGSRRAAPTAFGLDCRKECIGNRSPGPQCVLADNTSESGHDSPPHRLLAAVGDIGMDGLATRADLLKAWGKVDADEPCGRSDIMVKGGSVTNLGAKCELTGAFAGPGSGVTIMLPEAIVGKYTRSGASFSIAFPNLELAPSVRFESPWLDHDFGGATRKIERYGEYFIVSQPKACLALKL